jgi:hypothetical protein
MGLGRRPADRASQQDIQRHVKRDHTEPDERAQSRRDRHQPLVFGGWFSSIQYMPRSATACTKLSKFTG